MSLPNVLIFGGLDLVLPSIIQHIVPSLPAEPLVAHVRIVDRFIVSPPTTLISKELVKTLRERANIIEYRQGNLATPSVVQKSFTDPAPNGRPYSYIIDLTGEIMPGRPLEIYIRSLDMAVHIANAAAAQLARLPGSIKAYIRHAPPFYEPTDANKRYKEEDEEGWKPRGQRGAWWHESLRAVGRVEGLPLVVIRLGLVYGESFGKFEGAAFILLGLVYKYLGREMKLLWSPELPKSSLNIYDFAGAIWAAAEWMSTKTRAEANALAGVVLPPCDEPSIVSSNASNLVPPSTSVIAPTFNVVDDSDSTQGSMSAVIGKVYDIKVGFLEMSDSAYAGMKLSDMTQEANEVHMEAWYEIIMKSKSPVPNTPLSPFMPLGFVLEHGYRLDGDKFKRMVPYKFRYPQFDERAVRDYIDWCRRQEIWPEIS